MRVFVLFWRVSNLFPSGSWCSCRLLPSKRRGKFSDILILLRIARPCWHAPLSSRDNKPDGRSNYLTVFLRQIKHDVIIWHSKHSPLLIKILKMAKFDGTPTERENNVEETRTTLRICLYRPVPGKCACLGQSKSQNNSASRHCTPSAIRFYSVVRKVLWRR